MIFSAIIQKELEIRKENFDENLRQKKRKPHENMSCFGVKGPNTN